MEDAAPPCFSPTSDLCRFRSYLAARPSIQRSVAALYVALTIITVSVGLAMVTYAAGQQAAQQKQSLLRLASDLQTRISTKFEEVVGISTSAAAFAAAAATTAP